MKKAKLVRVSASVFALLLGVSSTATVLANANASKVHAFFGTSATKYVTDENAGETNRYKSEYSTWEEQYEHAEELIRQIEREGSVLVKNDGALPLEKGAKVSIMSRSSTDIVYGGTGSGSIDPATLEDFKSAMEQEGFVVNDTLWNFYLSQSNYERTTSDVAEVPISEYTEDVIDSYKEYGDAAIVVISRTGGEGFDESVEAQYLELQDSEKELLKHTSENFDKVIVLINSSNAMSLNWLDEYDVDACLWIGGPGQTGLEAVAEILDGTANPSGKFADTYAASTLSSPAMQNFGDYNFSNASAANKENGTGSGDEYESVLTDSQGEEHTVSNASTYVVYAEGIYVGYKYYETRYEDCVMGNGNASSAKGIYKSSDNAWNYDEEVDYTLGYGLSYTTFEQKLESVKEDDDTVTLTVNVTNTGNTYSGKDVVEVYVQAPYTAGGVEKASVQLCGFEKTKELAPGESQSVDVTVNKKDIASYDYKENKTYILDEGTYYFGIGSDAHDALNNILNAKGYTVENGMDAEGDSSKVYVTEMPFERLDVDSISGNEISNLFDTADLNYYYDDDYVTYLSRADWDATWPESYTDVALTDEMIDDITNDTDADETEVSDITYGADNGLNIADMIEVAYDDEKWDDLLDQMTLEEQVEMVQNGASQTASALSISFAGTVDADGPAGLGSATGRRYYYDNPEDESTKTSTSALGYNSAVVMASTWNKELIYERGESIGEDGLWTNTVGWWGPGANTHRTPYGGRNFEYYSEDAYLGGMIGANDIAGAQSKGMRPFIKHFAVNDQEMNRHGIATFSNEQALREIYLKQFQYIVQEGNVNSLMGSFNRIGCIWAGAHSGLINGLLKGEWGFKGTVETDFNFHTPTYYMTILAGLKGGTSQWLAIGDSGLMDAASSDKGVAAEVRNACHDILYSVVKTAAMNGINGSTYVTNSLAWWQILLIVLDVISAALTGVSIFFVYKKKRPEVIISCEK